MTPDNPKRPMEGWYLRDGLKKLAEICAIADGLRLSLTDPLTPEDIAAGAEPLSVDQIAEDLDRIASIATSLAQEEMQATTDEWYAATDAIS